MSTHDLNEFTQSTLNQNEDKLKAKTLRTSHQEKINEINTDINRSLKIKKGAENLLAVSRSKVLRKKIQNETDLEYQTLKQLKSKLDVLHSSFSIYQKIDNNLPMIPIGLKVTKQIDFIPSFSKFIFDHYHMDPNELMEVLESMNISRQKIENPVRSEEGITDFSKYHNLISYADPRFFDERIQHAIHFSWADSFTGEEHTQRSLAFEKSSIIFNLAALCSQIAVRINIDSPKSLDERIKLFLKAQVNLKFLKTNFSLPPSKDMAPASLTLLISIMEAQVEECNLMKLAMELDNDEDYQQIATFIGGAKAVSNRFARLTSKFDDIDAEEWMKLQNIVPSSWITLCEIKSAYYQAHTYQKLSAILINLTKNCKEGSLSALSLVNDSGGQALNKQLAKVFEAIQPFGSFQKAANSKQKKKNKISVRRSDSVNSTRSNKLRRPFSSLSLHSRGKQKSKKNVSEDTHLALMGSQSSLGSSSRSFSNLQDITTLEEFPTNEKEALDLGYVCLNEAIHYLQTTIKTLKSSRVLSKEESLDKLLNDCVISWQEQLKTMKLTLDFGFPSQNNIASSKTSKHRWHQRSHSVSITPVSETLETVDKPIKLIWAVPEFKTVPLRMCINEDIKPLKKVSLKTERDPFKKLGPLTNFNARQYWTNQTTITLKCDDLVGYGFSIQGAAPVEILGVDPDSPAFDAGLRSGDLIVAINGKDTSYSSHNTAVALIKYGPSSTGDLATDSTHCTEMDTVEMAYVRYITQPKPTIRSKPGEENETSKSAKQSSSRRKIAKRTKRLK